ncbi:MAG: O-antigen ligase family protein [bacterium]|nr:O-antigen ligase family protein [bacterium]
MWVAGLDLSRVVLALILLANTFAFAGVDPSVRTATAILSIVLILGLRKLPDLLPAHLYAGIALLSLFAIQLIPLPQGIRRLLQPGFAEFMHTGWAPLSLAPWATVQTAASCLVAAALAFAAAKMASSRSGLPMLLMILALTGAAVAALGLAGETGEPGKILFLRDNTPQGLPYGPFINHNHFGVAIELTLPAALALLLVSLRHIRISSGAVRSAIAIAMGSAAVAAVSLGALLRSRSRGGMLFLALAFILTLPLWRRRLPIGRKFLIIVLVLFLAAASMALLVAQTQLQSVKENFTELFVLDGARNNSRWQLWDATLASWKRAPLLGSGAGSYRHVIGLDKPATGANMLHQAHNDWLEWASTTGIVGLAIVSFAAVGMFLEFRPKRLSRFRFEFRYPMAAAALALTAVCLHESIGFGLQTPLNRYLCACWVGMVWGMAPKLRLKRKREESPASTVTQEER